MRTLVLFHVFKAFGIYRPSSIKYQLSLKGYIFSLKLAYEECAHWGIKCMYFFMLENHSLLPAYWTLLQETICFCFRADLCNKALLLMGIEEFQNLASFILHRIWQIIGECLCKIDLRYIVLNEVLNVIFNVVSNHDSILLSSETVDANFVKRVLIAHKIQLLTCVFVYI